MDKARPMKKRPTLLVLIAIALCVAPVFYYFAPALFFGKPLMGLSQFIAKANWPLLTAVFAGPLVGALILTVRPVGWYAVMAYSALFVLFNAMRMTFDAKHIAVFASAVVSLACAIYFVRREVRSPYFNPQLRWWERVRIRVKLRVDVAGREGFDSSTFDISDTGLFLATDSAFNAGEKVELTLHLPEKQLPAAGEVVWVSDGSRANHPKGVGIRFNHRQPEVKQQYKILRKQALVATAA